MRTIAHISDLHFGHVDPRVCDGLVADVEALAPSLVAVSGDLTQRAKVREFVEASEFLSRFRAPVLCVPGNHDVPLYNVARRFAEPLARYRRYISDDLSPMYEDAELAVLGINTARSLTFKGGRISSDQIDAAWHRFAAAPADVFRAVVTHHQFLPPPGAPRRGIVGRAPRALGALEASGVDLLLAGHLHTSYTGDARSAHRVLKRSIVVVQAGTATSTRSRGESNSYNVVTVGDGRIAVQVREWSGDAFVEGRRTTFTKHGHEWLLDR